MFLSDPMPQRLAILLGFLFLAPASVPTQRAGDSFEAHHKQALAANPPDVHLKISLDAGQSTFHRGDTIRLKYEFTADSPGKYVAGARFLDRGSRSVLETFLTDRPADARDPLLEFWEFRSALGGSNLFAPRNPTLKLDTSPQFDSVELTHYLRFAKPGRYRLYVVTRSALPPAAPVKEQGGPPIASENVITLHVLPQDLAATPREVDEIVARAHQQPSPRFTPVEAFRLFEISTPKARKAAASLYTRRNNYPASDDIALATILAAPTRAEAIALLNARIRDTSLVADEELLIDLGMLQFMQKHPLLTASAIRSADKPALAAWRLELAALVVANWEIVASTLDRRPPDIRASTVHWLDHFNSFYFYSQPLPVPPADGDRIRAQHLATLPDQPAQELANDLLNFRWTKSLPSDSVLAILMQIYASPPVQNAAFIRETALKEIAKLDPDKAQTLFRERMLDMDTPLDWNRIHSLNLLPSADLDAELIRILEDRWTERMSRVAPIIGLYASPAILLRVRAVYEVYGAEWPCSIEAGLLTYFLRVDPAYGTEKVGPALSAYYDKGGSDCHRGNLLLDLATLRNGPELQPFVSAALNDPRPLVAAAGAQVTAFGDQAKIPLAPLLARLRALHDEWPDFDTRSSNDPDYLKKWNSGYNELERILSIDFVNAEDSPDKPAIWKQALDLCITDLCRNNLRQRLARSKF
jgi:hypothetical protein